MFVLKFTRDLLQDMKSTPVESRNISPFYCWHAHIYKLNNRKHIIFINDFSRLCVIIDGVRSSQPSVLKQKFIATLQAYLLSEGVLQSAIDAYLEAGTDIVISKTDSRSVLGTMKEITMHTTDTHLNFADHIARMKWLNKLIYKPIDYKEPRKVFIEALNGRAHGASIER